MVIGPWISQSDTLVYGVKIKSKTGGKLFTHVYRQMQKIFSGWGGDHLQNRGVPTNFTITKAHILENQGGRGTEPSITRSGSAHDHDVGQLPFDMSTQRLRFLKNDQMHSARYVYKQIRRGDQVPLRFSIKWDFGMVKFV